MMMSLQVRDYGYIFVSGLLIFVICASPVKAGKTITVDHNNCGGSINLDSVQRLQLKYYGVKLQAQYCLFNVTSYNSNPEMEICIYNHDYESWEISCGNSIKITIGKYYGYNIPSRLHCTDFKPLCTSERKVFLEYQYDRTLQIMGLDVNLKFDVYLRIKPETTTKRLLTTGKETLPYKGSGIADISITWIILGSMGGFMFLVFCCALCFFCCCSNEEGEQTQTQGDQAADVNEVNLRMIETAAVQEPPKQLDTNSAEPPDYYAVCGGDDRYNSNATGYGDEKVMPSAPVQPSAPPQEAPPPPYSGMNG